MNIVIFISKQMREIIYLSPNKGSHTKQQTPGPLLKCEPMTSKCIASKMDNYKLKLNRLIQPYLIFIGFYYFYFYLKTQSHNPNSIKNWIGKKSFEYVAFTVYFSRVDFIEQGHQDERVEDHCKMLRRLESSVDCYTRIYIE